MAQTVQKLADWPIPRIGLGTAAWKSPKASASQQEATELVHYFVSKGTALFDTSPLYGTRKFETWLGEALQGVPRSQYIISTKAGYDLDINPPENARPKTVWTRENILTSVENSLKRLKTDYLDIVHLHDPDCCLKDALEIVFPTLAELRAQGVIRAVGAGMNQWEMLAEFARNADFDCFLLAGRYSLLEQASLPLFPLCEQKGIALLLGGVYNTGILAGGAQPGALYNYRPAPLEILERVRWIEAVCQRHGVTLRAVALHFPLAQPAVRCLVLGMEKPEQYDQAKEALQMVVPDSVWSELRQERLISPDAPVPGITSA